MFEDPLVSIVILSHNKRELLQRTLKKILYQDYSNIEIYVVDNASTDGTIEMLSEFPTLNLIQLKENRGIGAWNEGLRLASGDYVLILDDDAYPTPGSIKKGVDYLKDHSECQGIAFNLYDSADNNFRPHWLPDITVEEAYVPIFVGCAGLFRNNGMVWMDEEYFIYQHELPVCARIYNSGMYLYYNREIAAYHYFKPERVFNEKQHLRNNLRFLLDYCPLRALPWMLIHELFYFITRAARRGWLKDFFKIVWGQIKAKGKKDTRISYSYLIEIRKAKILNMGIRSKFENIKTKVFSN
jgi:GT2 family glycosyltransferase